MKRVITLALLLTVAMLAACGAPAAQDATTAPAQEATKAPEATTASTGDTPEETAEPEPESLSAVKLTVYFLGDGTRDDQEVFDQLNEYTSSLINTTFERKLLSWSDYNTKYPLIFASGEDFDLIYTSNWSFYASQAVKGGFAELTNELLDQYAPDIVRLVPDAAWRQARINGKVYMVPNVQLEYNNLGILIRGDLRKKYDLPELASLDDFEAYLDAVAKNEKGIIPLDGGSEFDKWTNSSLWFHQPNAYRAASVSGYVQKIDDPSGAMLKVIDLPEYQDYLRKMVDFKNRGFWSKNALNNETRLDDGFKNGKSASALHNLGTMVNAWRITNKEHPEWEAEVYDSLFGVYPCIRTSFLGNGMGIHATSKNIERSLMWLNVFRNDQTAYDLMMSGIEGKHWINEGEGLSSPGPDNGEYGGFSNWGFTQQEFIRQSTDQWPKWNETLQSYLSRTVDTAHPYFNFDDTEVKNETAALTNIDNKYGKQFDFGFDPNWETSIVDVDKQRDAAGRDKVLELAQAQLEAFIEEYTK